MPFVLTADEALALPGIVVPIPSWNTLRAILLAQYPEVVLRPPVQTIVTGYVWDYVAQRSMFIDSAPRLYAHTFVLCGDDTLVELEHIGRHK